MIQLSNSEVIRLYKLASIGKLFGGLVHNLNGPLQNLGLDIEIALYSLKDESRLNDDTVQGIITRLRRMEEEHEKLNSLIKTASAKTGECIEDGLCLNICDYIRQEIFFLNANLYFKHNVETEIIIEDAPASIQNFSKDSLTALGWFMQAFADELESQKLKGLKIKFVNRGSFFSVLFQTGGGTVSEKFVVEFQKAMTSPPSLIPENGDLGILITMIIFHANGITLEFANDASHTGIILNFPLPD
jgi:hypothetical protein